MPQINAFEFHSIIAGAKRTDMSLEIRAASYLVIKNAKLSRTKNRRAYSAIPGEN